MDAESLELLGTVDLFKQVHPVALEGLAAKMQLMSFPEGPIIKENDRSDGLYIIKSGFARVTKSDESRGLEAVLSILRPGNSFGELGLVDGLPRSATVTAMQPVECYFLRRDAFLTALDEHPEIAVALLLAIAGMVRSADRWLASSF